MKNISLDYKNLETGRQKNQKDVLMNWAHIFSIPPPS